MPRSNTNTATVNKLIQSLVVLGIAAVAAITSTKGCDFHRIFSQQGGSLDHLPPIEVYFSPQGGCTDAVVQTLNTAQSSVFVQAYSFTSAPIAQALVDALHRGVHVEAILDKSQLSEKYSSLDFLDHEGVLTWVDSKHAIAHNKIMIIDGNTVITGSFNFTNQAERSNAENLLIIRDAGLAQTYMANWQRHREHSDRYASPRGVSAPQQPQQQQRSRSRQQQYR